MPQLTKTVNQSILTGWHHLYEAKYSRYRAYPDLRGSRGGDYFKFKASLGYVPAWATEMRYCLQTTKYLKIH